MTDKKLAQLAKQYKQLKAAEDEAVSARKAVGDQLVAEMQRRETKGIITGGWKVTLVTPETVTYDPVALKRRLGEKFKYVTSLVVDPNKVGAAVQDGKVKLSTITACSTVTPKSSYVLVNPE